MSAAGAERPAPDAGDGGGHGRPRRGLADAVRAVLADPSSAPPPGIRLRLAGMDDVPALRAINAAAIERLGRDGLFLRMSPEFFADMIRDGAVLVPDRDGEPLGYSIAVPASDAVPPFVPGTPTRGTGLLFGTAVGDALRGEHWHDRLLRLRIAAFEAAGHSNVQATVSPYNFLSLRNLLEAGLRARGLKDMLDGHPRFLLRRGFGQAPLGGPPETLPLPESGDLSAHEALLRRGYAATRLERGEDGAAVLRYAPAEPGAGEAAA